MRTHNLALCLFIQGLLCIIGAVALGIVFIFDLI